MMDLNDDLCRTDFFDFVKLENGANGLTPVAYIDSLDYAQTDGNNNLSATGGQIKTFLDEMLMSDPLGNASDTLQSSQGNLELLSSIPWPSTNGPMDPGLTTTNNTSNDPSPASWLLNSGAPGDGEVTTLTNLLDPLFVSYDDPKMDQYFSSVPTPDTSNTGAISSDLITTTFMNDSSTSPTTSSENDMLSWQKSPDVFCDESLLRSALQAGNHKITQQIQIPTTVMAVTQKIQSAHPPGTTDMTELRKVLSFPPLANGNVTGTVTLPTNNSSLISSGSPTSSDQIMIPEHHTNGGVTDLGDSHYYELKVLDSVFVNPDSVIPNVEELIMQRITPQFNGNGMKKGNEISEKKIHSTTLSAKWTYTTNTDQNKTPRKRNKKQNNLKSPGGMNGVVNGLQSTLNCDNNQRNGAMLCNMSASIGSPKSSQSSPSTNSTSSSTGNGNAGMTSRKERSLHYCTICSKGFKDKYSVNVHVRTHTGEKPFSCTLCGKNFRQKAHLAKHYQTHAAKANNPHGKGSKRAVSVAAS